MSSTVACQEHPSHRQLLAMQPIQTILRTRTQSNPAFSTAMPVRKSASPSPTPSLALHHQHLTPPSSPYPAPFSPFVTPPRSPPELTPDWPPAPPRASPSPVTITAEADLGDTIRKYFCNHSSRECPLLIQGPNTARFILECDAYLTRTKQRYELAHLICLRGYPGNTNSASMTATPFSSTPPQRLSSSSLCPAPHTTTPRTISLTSSPT